MRIEFVIIPLKKEEPNHRPSRLAPQSVWLYPKQYNLSYEFKAIPFFNTLTDGYDAFVFRGLFLRGEEDYAVWPVQVCWKGKLAAKARQVIPEVTNPLTIQIIPDLGTPIPGYEEIASEEEIRRTQEERQKAFQKQVKGLQFWDNQETREEYGLKSYCLGIKMIPGITKEDVY